MLLIKRKGKKLNGAAALVTLIIISFILLVAGVTLIYNTIDLNKSTRNYRIVNILQSEANSCLEDALLKIQRTPSLTGTINLTTANATCTSTISNHATNPSYKNITITATDGEYSYSQTRVVNYTQDPMVLVE